MGRFDLTDFEWSVIQPLLPNKVRGVKRVDDRRVLNGIFWRLRTGAPWADIPARYGPYTTCVNRFNRWRKAGVWKHILDAVSVAYEGDIQMIDSSSIRVHQHGANGKKKTSDPALMGHSRGGLTTKIHALVDAMGLPIMLKLTEGQAADGRSAADMFDTVGKGDILLADRAYDSDALRAEMDARGAWANIRAMPQRIRKPAFSHFLYKYRNLVERFFNKLKHFRAVATRYDQRDDNYLASVQLASIRIWLRHNESVTWGPDPLRMLSRFEAILFSARRQATGIVVLCPSLPTKQWTKWVKSPICVRGGDAKMASISKQNALADRMTVCGGHFAPISLPF